MDLSGRRERQFRYVEPTYARLEIGIESGKGATLFDFFGKEYVDFTSGTGVNLFGINDSVWKKAVTEQINQVQHAYNLYSALPQSELARLLCEKSGAKKVIFSNSGAEANECAVKTARKYNADKYGEGKRDEILVLNNVFRDGTATLSAARGAFHRYFTSFSDGFSTCEADDYESFLRAVNEHTGAVMLELIGVESGMRRLDTEFVKKVASYCKEHDILLMIDEVRTGNGRTGRMYCYQLFDIEPDVVTTAKGLGGGLPIGACLFFDKTAGRSGYGDRTPALGGNPVCCAGGVSVVKRLTDPFLAEVERKGNRIAEELKKIKNVEEVSGAGLMIGVRTTKPAKELALRCREKGLLVLTAHDRLTLLPPLNVTDSETEKGLRILKEVIEE